MDRRAEILRRLTVVRWVALADALLLVPLVVAALSDAEGLVSILGPIHGVGFLALLLLCVQGAGEGLWGWWSSGHPQVLRPLPSVVTLGPPGSLIGDVRIRRRVA